MSHQQKYPGHITFWNEGASCYLESYGGHLTLYSLLTEPTKRRQGHAKALVAEAQAFARELGKPLVLFARAFADRAVPTPKLVEFYQSMGFVITHEDGDTTWLRYSN